MLYDICWRHNVYFLNMFYSLIALIELERYIQRRCHVFLEHVTTHNLNLSNLEMASWALCLWLLFPAYFSLCLSTDYNLITFLDNSCCLCSVFIFCCRILAFWVRLSLWCSRDRWPRLFSILLCCFSNYVTERSI